MPDGFGGWDQFDDDAHERFAANARKVDRAFLSGLALPPPLDPAKWAEKIKFPEGSPVPGSFRHDTAPYLREILEVLSPEHPCQEIYIPKCAQSGGTVVADIWLGSILDTMNAPCMVVHPTVSQAKEWADSKFYPLAEATPALNPHPEEDEKPGAVIPRQNRTTGGSKADKIRALKGSTILLSGAESPKTLRSHTIRYMVQDDLDAWTDSAGKEGDPERLADKRLTTYKALGTSKKIAISTPLIARASRIMRGYDRSDRRRLYMGCLHCDDVTDFDWEDVQRNEQAPWDCHVICPSCGGIHTDADKREMLRRSIWVPTAPVDGEQPDKTLTREEAEAWRAKPRQQFRVGFWITGVISRFLRWGDMAQEEADAGDDDQAMMVFVNTVLGRVFEIKTKTPDWEALAARKTPDFMREQGAYGPLVFTLSVDVQRDGLYFLVKGYNANEEGWYLDWGFLAGDTEEDSDTAWKKLTEIVNRGAPLPGGESFPFDVIVVDGKYHTDAVKNWCKRRPTAIVINGAEGWTHPVIKGATETDIKKSGKKKKFGGQKIWHVGTWTVKTIVVGRYNKTLQEATELGPPRGHCWFPADAEDALFKQLTSEYLATKLNRKSQLPERFWKARGDNHWFDCDVYSFAGLHYLGARAGRRGSWSEEQWEEREDAIRQLVEAAGGQLDLFDMARRKTANDSAANDVPAGPAKSSDLPAALAAMARSNQ